MPKEKSLSTFPEAIAHRAVAPFPTVFAGENHPSLSLHTLFSSTAPLPALPTAWE
jgi:hypothetical protein